MGFLIFCLLALQAIALTIGYVRRSRNAPLSLDSVGYAAEGRTLLPGLTRN
jgi:hypothetical protein